jgi:hypothetical protein
MVTLAILAFAVSASANSFTKDGIVLDANHGYTFQGDRCLIPDGSFEGLCGATWMCDTDVTCEWITDLVPLGLWNFDGMAVAWLGGYCGTAVCWTYICQTLVVLGGQLSWWWMAYVNYGELAQAPGVIYVTIDGVIVFTLYLTLDMHLLDYQQIIIDISIYVGLTVIICFEWHNEEGCIYGESDNYFLDFVEWYGIAATEDTSFSTVKALY